MCLPPNHSCFSLCLSRSKVPEFIKMMSDHFLWRHFHDNLAIDPSKVLMLLPDQSDSLELRPGQSDQPLSLLIHHLWTSFSPLSPPSVENTDFRVIFIAFITLHSPLEVNWMLLWRLWITMVTWLHQSGSPWELVTHSNMQWQHPRNFSSSTTCFSQHSRF